MPKTKITSYQYIYYKTLKNSHKINLKPINCNVEKMDQKFKKKQKWPEMLKNKDKKPSV